MKKKVTNRNSHSQFEALHQSDVKDVLEILGMMGGIAEVTLVDLTTPRPTAILNHYSRMLPGFWKISDLVRSETQKYWPDYCHAPFGIWGMSHLLATGATLAQFHNLEELRSTVVDVELLNILGNWRIGQGIYRFDQALLQAVSSTPVSSHFSAEAFYSLPEFGIYVETPGHSYRNFDLHGFFACLSHNPRLGRSLRLALDTEQGLLLQALSLEASDLEAAMMDPVRWMAKMNENSVHEFLLPMAEEQCRTEANLIQPLISLLMFICTRNNEISSSKGVKPTIPAANKTKHGERIFAASTPTTWDVGLRLGAALRHRQPYERTSPSISVFTGQGTKRPHLRGAHWHKFLLGRRKDSNDVPIAPEFRDHVTKWIPPKLVKCDSPDGLVATLHPVPID